MRLRSAARPAKLPALLTTVLTGALLGTTLACSAPSEPGTSSGGGDEKSMVLADGSEYDTLNPLLGFGDGVGQFYDGLITYDADLSVRPALAAEVPKPREGGKKWTVRLRKGVKFHDGSDFDAADVVATYRAALNPKSGSTVRSDYAMIDTVTAQGSDQVTFTLRYAYTPFVHRLRLGILPSEKLPEGQPLEKSTLNTEPIGTGPYELAEWRKGDRLVLAANDDYWGGRPKLDRVTVVSVPDDNTRAQRMRNGDFDATVLPPTLTESFEKTDDARVLTAKTVDGRDVMLPMHNPVTGDRAIRLALNHAVDRAGMVKAALAGHGQPAYTPIPTTMKEYADPRATFDHDPGQAERELDAAGWKVGKDGIRVKGKQRARFNLLYPADDSLRKALATAVASDARKVGIEVELSGLGWEAIQPRMDRDAVLMGGGSPFDADLQTYGQVASSEAGNGYNNPGSYDNPNVDAALDRARRTADEAARAKQYRAMGRELIKDPARVYLVNLEHTYVLRGEWKGYRPVLEGHIHDATGWGPWWNLRQWERADDS